MDPQMTAQKLQPCFSLSGNTTFDLCTELNPCMKTGRLFIHKHHRLVHGSVVSNTPLPVFMFLPGCQDQTFHALFYEFPEPFGHLSQLSEQEVQFVCLIPEVMCGIPENHT